MEIQTDWQQINFNQVINFGSLRINFFLILKTSIKSGEASKFEDWIVVLLVQLVAPIPRTRKLLIKYSTLFQWEAAPTLSVDRQCRTRHRRSCQLRYHRKRAWRSPARCPAGSPVHSRGPPPSCPSRAQPPHIWGLLLLLALWDSESGEPGDTRFSWVTSYFPFFPNLGVFVDEC